MNGIEERVGRDVSAVLHLLRGRGPRSMGRLCVEMASASWDPERVERAVIAAWGDNLVSFDADDQLIVL